jgi:hypothetical protein
VKSPDEVSSKNSTTFEAWSDGKFAISSIGWPAVNVPGDAFSTPVSSVSGYGSADAEDDAMASADATKVNARTTAESRRTAMLLQT